MMIFCKNCDNSTKSFYLKTNFCPHFLTDFQTFFNKLKAIPRQFRQNVICVFSIKFYTNPAIDKSAATIFDQRVQPKS